MSGFKVGGDDSSDVEEQILLLFVICFTIAAIEDQRKIKLSADGRATRLHSAITSQSPQQEKLISIITVMLLRHKSDRIISTTHLMKRNEGYMTA